MTWGSILQPPLRREPHGPVFRVRGVSFEYKKLGLSAKPSISGARLPEKPIMAVIGRSLQDKGLRACFRGTPPEGRMFSSFEA